MSLDEVAGKLGYVDVKHLEDNIYNYGEPLIEWWGVIKELSEKLESYTTIKCSSCNTINKKLNHITHCECGNRLRY